MLTQRDTDVIDYIEQNKVVRTSSLRKFFPSDSVCHKRLRQLCDAGILRRERDACSAEYIYFTAKPKQLRHSLMVSDFHRELEKQTDVICFLVEPTFGKIRPDAAFGYKSHGRERVGLLEVELSNKGFDADKYIKFDWQKHFDEKPDLFVVSNRKIPSTGYGMTRIKTDLKFEI